MSIWSSVISGVASLGSTWLNNYYQQQINNQNLAFQREANDKNEALMRESWQRDDTAVQRQVADLQAAGLSKQLAGSGASNIGAIKVDPLENKGGYKSGLVDALQMSQAFASKDAEISLLKQQANQVEQDIKNSANISQSNVLNNRVNFLRNLLSFQTELSNYETFGKPKFDTKFGKALGGFFNFFNGGYSSKENISLLNDFLFSDYDNLSNFTLGREMNKSSIDEKIQELDNRSNYSVNIPHNYVNSKDGGSWSYKYRY